MNASPTDNTWPHERNELRRALRARRQEWWASPDARLAENRLGEQLQGLLRQLEPMSLGLYWALDGEFNAADWALAHKLDATLQLALPFARKAGPNQGPASMSFHRWDGSAPTRRDECDIPTANGAVMVPEVLLVPCLGFTREGYRLGYGGGYFDRWLEEHPGVTTIGLAWACCEVPFEVQPHDQPLTIVLTENEIIAP